MFVAVMRRRLIYSRHNCRVGTRVALRSAVQQRSAVVYILYQGLKLEIKDTDKMEIGQRRDGSSQQGAGGAMLYSSSWGEVSEV